MISEETTDAGPTGGAMVSTEAAHPAPQRRRRYTAAEKLEIVEAARTTSVALAPTRYRVSRGSIHGWINHKRIIVHNKLASRRCSHRTDEAVEDAHARASAAQSSCGESSASLIGSTPQGDIEETQISRSTGQSISPSLPTQPTLTPTRVSSSHGLARLQLSAPTDGGGGSGSRPMIVVISGEQGGFAAYTARRVFTDLISANALPAPAFKLAGYPQAVHALTALHSGENDYAVIPFDALFSTGFRAAMARVITHRLMIVGEIVSEEEVCICALPTTRLDDIDCVISDIHSLSRHEEYVLHLEDQFKRTVVRQTTWDSSTACRLVREEQAPNTAVLCRKEAAVRNGLCVLQERLPNSMSRTKYAVLGRKGTERICFGSLNTEGGSRLQTALLLATSGRANLHGIVSAFANLNLTIEVFDIRNNGDEPVRSGQSCIVSYRRNTEPSTEAALDRELTMLADRVIDLGTYDSYVVHT